MTDERVTEAAPPGWVDRAGSPPPSPPDIVGYRIEALIHRGGQGSVFRAIQASTGRPVAIKVLRSGHLATEADRRRFEREVDIVAGLDHPNVVSIIDRGTVDGAPYFVMRLVEGEDLDVHVERTRPALEKRLKLFLDVCDAVSHAHARAVLHRDLKPRNIRVDTQGRANVLDFGLGKPLDAAADARGSSLSIDGVFMGTLEWAAPEQLAADSSRVDVRTDVHALGLILYWLLTGTHARELTGDLAEDVARISTQEVVPPRERVRGLDRDLDTIALRALSKDAERRYQSVDALAADVRRHLAGEPVEARRDSRWYLLARTARRHRALVALGCLSVATLLAALVMTLGQLRRARAAEALALASAETARTESASSAAVTDFMVTLVRHSYDPRSESFSPAKFAELARARMDTDLARQPAVRRRVALTLGELYREMGDPDRALATIEHALEEDPGDDPEAMANLISARSTALVGLERLSEAERDARDAIERNRRLHGRDSRAVAIGLNTLGSILAMQDRPAEARAAWEESLRAFETLEDESDRDTRWMIKSNLAAFAENMGEHAEGERLSREVIEEKVRGGATEDSIAWSRRQRSIPLVALGRAAEAEAELRTAIDVLSCLRAEHAELPRTWWRLADALAAQDRMAEAVWAAEEGASRAARIWTPDTPERLGAESKLVGMLTTAGRSEEALIVARAAAEALWSRRDPPPCTLVTTTWLRWAEASIATGDATGALALVEAARAEAQSCPNTGDSVRAAIEALRDDLHRQASLDLSTTDAGASRR